MTFPFRNLKFCFPLILQSSLAGLQITVFKRGTWGVYLLSPRIGDNMCYERQFGWVRIWGKLCFPNALSAASVSLSFILEIIPKYGGGGPQDTMGKTTAGAALPPRTQIQNSAHRFGGSPDPRELGWGRAGREAAGAATGLKSSPTLLLYYSGVLHTDHLERQDQTGGR